LPMLYKTRFAYLSCTLFNTIIYPSHSEGWRRDLSLRLKIQKTT